MTFFNKLCGGSVLEEIDYLLAYLMYDCKDLFILKAVQVRVKAYKVIKTSS